MLVKGGEEASRHAPHPVTPKQNPSQYNTTVELRFTIHLLGPPAPAPTLDPRHALLEVIPCRGVRVGVEVWTVEL